jgi:hypothetical protein
MYKDFDKNIDKFFEQEIKNQKKKPHKPIRVIIEFKLIIRLLM